MTNYNERLDKILMGVWHEGYNRCNQEKNHPDGYDNYSYSMNENQAKQAFTSLMKELVAEAKPFDYIPEGHEADACLNHEKYTSACCGCQRQRARLRAIDEFEQNLLKALSNNGKAE